MHRFLGINIPEVLWLPNLLSLSRIAITPFIGYYLWRGDNQATLISIILLVVAGITDLIDGYIARRSNQVSHLGMILDPLADKILAATLVVLLIFFRDFPIWLAGVIVARDLVIAAAGMILLRGSYVVIPSNQTGKHAFAAIAFLLASYIMRFDFGAMLMTYVAVILIAASTVLYTREYVFVRRGMPRRSHVDRPVHKIIRAIITVAILAVYFYRLFLFLFG